MTVTSPMTGQQCCKSLCFAEPIRVHSACTGVVGALPEKEREMINTWHALSSSDLGFRVSDGCSNDVRG